MKIRFIRNLDVQIHFNFSNALSMWICVAIASVVKILPQKFLYSHTVWSLFADRLTTIRVQAVVNKNHDSYNYYSHE